jgi:hypothetical protein
MRLWFEDYDDASWPWTPLRDQHQAAVMSLQISYRVTSHLPALHERGGSTQVMTCVPSRLALQLQLACRIHTPGYGNVDGM